MAEKILNLRMERSGFVILVVLALFLTGLIACAYISQAKYSEQSLAMFKREASFQLLGGWFYGIGRQNILEKNYGSMLDIPGGYNDNPVYDVVGPSVPPVYSFHVTRLIKGK